MRPRYVIFCPRCVELSLPSRHTVGSPRARGCKDHQAMLRARAFVKKNRKRKALWTRRDYRRHAEKRREGARSAYQAKRKQKIAAQKDYYARNRSECVERQRVYRARPQVGPADEPIRREIQRLAMV